MHPYNTDPQTPPLRTALYSIFLIGLVPFALWLRFSGTGLTEGWSILTHTRSSGQVENLLPFQAAMVALFLGMAAAAIMLTVVGRRYRTAPLGAYVLLLVLGAGPAIATALICHNFA